MLCKLQKDKSLLDLVPDHPVPRYTSYPTAPNFKQNINGKIYSSWLKKIESSEKFSLYIHIPFCNSLCYFCGCNTISIKKYDPVERYVKFLVKEICLISSKIKFKPCVSHIHFGGGTPSILKPKDLKVIMNTINNKFNILKKSEIAMEVDPRYFKLDLINVLKKHNFNRISVGVQDFSKVVQKNINRNQSFKNTKDLVESFRTNGINKINIDLMYGLPYQSVLSFISTLNKVVSLKPDCISIFGYAHVPWMKKRQKLIKGKVLDNKERLQLCRIASDYLSNKNYISVGIDHYARHDSSLIKKLKKRNLTRNFQGYSGDDSRILLGFGSSSISSLLGGYIQNISNVVEYIESLKRNKMPIFRGYKFKNKDEMYGNIIGDLMCYLSVDLQEINRKFNKENKQNFLVNELQKVKPFIDKGFVTLKNDILTIKPYARPLTRIISSSFDKYFKTNKTKYSLGI